MKKKPKHICKPATASEIMQDLGIVGRRPKKRINKKIKNTSQRTV